MNFFNEYSNFTKTGLGGQADRLNHRYEGIIEWNKEIIADRRILDIGSHDGRWAFAAIKAGAKHVTCIEPREGHVSNLHANMTDYGVENYFVVQGDVHEELQYFNENQFDMIFCLGFFYHTLEHGSLMRHFKRLKPDYIIFDTDIIRTLGPMISLKYEKTKSGLYAVGEEKNKLVGVPTIEAVEMMCDAYGFDYEIHTYDQSLNDSMYVGKSRSRITLRATRR